MLNYICELKQAGLSNSHFMFMYISFISIKYHQEERKIARQNPAAGIRVRTNTTYKLTRKIAGKTLPFKRKISYSPI